MTTQEQMVSQIIAQVIAEKVVEKLLARQKKALVIFTGAKLGVPEGLLALQKLRQDGFTFDVLLSRSAGKLLDADAIQSALAPAHFWVEEADCIPETLVKQYETFIVPALTVQTVASLAQCIADTPARTVIFNAMMRGKCVVAAVDGCCPDNAGREVLGYHMPEPLKQKLRDNMATLTSFGAKLTVAERLHGKTQRAIGLPVATVAPAKPTPVPSATAPKAGVIAYKGGKVLGATTIAQCANHATLEVPTGTLVTQMASDAARQRNITITFQS